MTKLFWKAAHSLTFVRRVSDRANPLAFLIPMCGRIGPSLLTLTIDNGVEFIYERDPLWSDLSNVANICPNLEALDFRAREVNVPRWMRFDAFSALKRLRHFRQNDWLLFRCQQAQIPPSVEVVEGLDLRYGGFGWADVEAFLRSHPALRKLRLEIPDDYETRFFSTVAECCPLLKHLELRSACDTIAGLGALEGMKHISVWGYGNTKEVTVEQLKTIGERNPGLEVLQIDNFISHEHWKEGWSVLGTGLRQLRCLAVKGGLPKFGSDFVDHVTSYWGATLRHLDAVDGLQPYPLSTLDVIGERCPQLRSLALSMKFSYELDAKLSAMIDRIVEKRKSSAKNRLRITLHVQCGHGFQASRLRAWEGKHKGRCPDVTVKLPCTTLPESPLTDESD